MIGSGDALGVTLASFCSRCGTALTQKVPDGDDRTRGVCDGCGFIHYDNPRVVVGALATDAQGRVLLCKRAIAPRVGYWTLPAGFLELNETAAEGAARETMEEAGATIVDMRPLTTFDIPRIGQIYMMFRARLAGPEMAAGTESLEVGLYEWADIPWDDLAFAAVRFTLERFAIDREAGVERLHSGTIQIATERDKRASGWPRSILVDEVVVG